MPPAKKKRAAKKVARKQPAKKAFQPKKIDHIPSLSDQGFEVVRLDNDILMGRKGTPRFNGSIIDFEGKTLIAYRYYEPNMDYKMQIGITELDEEFKPIPKTSRHIRIVPHGSTGIFEDCRLFIHNNKLWMSFSELDLVAIPHNPRVIQRCVQLGKNLSQAQDTRIKYEENYKKVEKNWMFASGGEGNLRFIYDLPTMNRAIVDPSGNCDRIKGGQKICWNIGYLRGGTPLVPYTDNTLIGFYHISTHSQWLLRRYGMGAIVVDNDTLALVSMTYPFLYGSRYEEYCGSGNPQVVFPSGAVEREDYFAVSCGVNDTFNAVVKVPKEKITSELLPAHHFHTDNGRCWRVTGSHSIDSLEGKSQMGTIISHSGTHGPTRLIKTEDEYSVKFLEQAPFAEEIPLSAYEGRIAMLESRMSSIPQGSLPDYLRKRKDSVDTLVL